MPPQDAIEQETPPAFPPWLRRINPLLAEEDDNAIFEAFRRRRVVHQRRWSVVATLRHVSTTARLAVLALIVFVLSVWVLPLVAVVAPLFIGMIIQRIPWYPQSQKELPRNLSSLVVGNIHFSQALVDLDLLPDFGRMVIRALYLELVETEWQRAVLAMVTVLLVVGTVFWMRVEPGVLAVFTWLVVCLTYALALRWNLRLLATSSVFRTVIPRGVYGWVDAAFGWFLILMWGPLTVPTIGWDIIMPMRMIGWRGPNHELLYWILFGCIAFALIDRFVLRGLLGKHELLSLAAAESAAQSLEQRILLCLGDPDGRRTVPAQLRADFLRGPQ